MKKKKARSKKDLFLTKKALIVLIILAVLLALLLIFIAAEVGIIRLDITNFYQKPKVYSIRDACSFIAGRVIHPIKNEDVCTIKCKDECILNNMEFDKIEFLIRENNCNLCNCYCR